MKLILALFIFLFFMYVIFQIFHLYYVTRKRRTEAALLFTNTAQLQVSSPIIATKIPF